MTATAAREKARQIAQARELEVIERDSSTREQTAATRSREKTGTKSFLASGNV